MSQSRSASLSAALPLPFQGAKRARSKMPGTAPRTLKEKKTGHPTACGNNPGRRSRNDPANCHKTCQQRILGRRETLVAKAHHEGDKGRVAHPPAYVLDPDCGNHRRVAFSDQGEGRKREVGQGLHKTKNPKRAVYADLGYDAPAHQSAHNRADQPEDLVDHADIRTAEADIEQKGVVIAPAMTFPSL